MNYEILFKLFKFIKRKKRVQFLYLNKKTVNPYLTDTKVFSNEIDNACPVRREECYTRYDNSEYCQYVKLRVCTVADIETEFAKYKKLTSSGLVYSEENSHAVVAKSNSNGKVVISQEDASTKYSAWCCDDECLPDGSKCVNDDQCCNFICQGYCKRF